MAAVDSRSRALWPKTGSATRGMQGARRAAQRSLGISSFDGRHATAAEEQSVIERRNRGKNMSIDCNNFLTCYVEALERRNRVNGVFGDIR